MIELAKTVEYPSGVACLIWAEMENRFAPDDEIAEMDMEDELAKLKIKKNENPKDIADAIAAIQIKYGCVINDARKAAIIMRAGKAHYAAVLTTTANLIRITKSRGATANEYLTEMHMQWRIENKSGGKDDDEEVNKAALADPSFLGKFNGKCYKCGKTGHRAANYPNGNSGGSGNGNGGNNGRQGKVHGNMQQLWVSRSQSR